ncbi:MAG: hypothetical protein ACRDNS_23955, partial [Trebonia sp.]
MRWWWHSSASAFVFGRCGTTSTTPTGLRRSFVLGGMTCNGKENVVERRTPHGEPVGGDTRGVEAAY